MNTNDNDTTFAQAVAASSTKFKRDMAALVDQLPPDVRDVPLSDENMAAFANGFKRGLARGATP